MTAQHTPGPWIACGHGDYSDYDGKCRVVLGEGGDIRTAVVLGLDTPENTANARLIAAAPDLLAALQVMLRDYAAVHDIGDVEMQPAIYQARAAIARATHKEGS